MTQSIAVLRGDGIGPEIMDATLHVLDTLDVGLDYHFVDAGQAAFEKTGERLPQVSLDRIESCQVALKGPLATPIGSGADAINVQLRHYFTLYANVRSAISYPNLRVPYQGLDLMVVRESVEGAYPADGRRQHADKDHGAFSEVVATDGGSERIARYAYALARSLNRRRITLVHKATLFPEVSGLFLDAARRVAQDYPEIETHEMLIDQACMQLVMAPASFDMLLTTNLFGDVLSALCAGLVGGPGMTPSASIGQHVAIFEAAHGTAMDIAGHGTANPCGLLLAAARMLEHMGMQAKAVILRRAIHDTLAMREALTPDIGGQSSTREFAQAIAHRCTG